MKRVDSSQFRPTVPALTSESLAVLNTDLLELPPSDYKISLQSKLGLTAKSTNRIKINVGRLEE